MRTLILSAAILGAVAAAGEPSDAEKIAEGRRALAVLRATLCRGDALTERDRYLVTVTNAAASTPEPVRASGMAVSAAHRRAILAADKFKKRDVETAAEAAEVLAALSGVRVAAWTHFLASGKISVDGVKAEISAAEKELAQLEAEKKPTADKAAALSLLRQKLAAISPDVPEF